jgi:hypothetical protein
MLTISYIISMHYANLPYVDQKVHFSEEHRICWLAE